VLHGTVTALQALDMGLYFWIVGFDILMAHGRSS
jgi:hypothetical protein